MTSNINLKELIDQLIPTIVKAVRQSIQKEYNCRNELIDDSNTPVATNVLKPEHLSGHIPEEIRNFLGPLPTSSESQGGDDRIKSIRKAFTTSLRDIRSAHLPV